MTVRSTTRILLAVLFVWAWTRIWQVVVALIVSVILAVTLEPVASWLERRRLPRWAAAGLPVLVLAAIVVAMGFAAVGSLKEQGPGLLDKARLIEQRTRETLPAAGPALDRLRSGETGSSLSHYGAAILSSAFRALVLIGIGLILTVYLLMEREKTARWVIAFFPKQRRAKAWETAEQSRRVIAGYVAGNMATSLFAFVFVLVALSLLRVPAAFLLAVLAGLCDFIPVLGFILSGVPATLLAATVAPTNALLVPALYVLYHFVENYFVAPRIYGDRLCLSNVAVIVAFAVGAELAGVIGALLALPVAAIYPTVERIWLRDTVGREAVEEHAGLMQSPG